MSPFLGFLGDDGFGQHVLVQVRLEIPWIGVLETDTHAQKEAFSSWERKDGLPHESNVCFLFKSDVQKQEKGSHTFIVPNQRFRERKVAFWLLFNAFTFLLRLRRKDQYTLICHAI